MNDYIWEDIASVEDLGNTRMNSMKAFLNDYEAGKKVGRYTEASLPTLSFEDKAVRLVRVNGIYQKGGGRTNREEADAVVNEVVRRLKDHTFNEEQRTIGVVTFNAEQQRLIENLLDEERRRHPDIERHFDEDLIEPVFIKNLEPVQGDERDIILFSTTYGPDDSGKISMNFGPLNREGGERRLNVAITRARSEMIVFSSLGSDDIDLSRTSATGVRDLKHFLDFTNRGVKALGEAVFGSVGDFDSPFEVAVARGLQERGWTVHPQIGVSAFRVDIGIVHPDFPGRYYDWC